MATYSCPTCGNALTRQSNNAAGAAGGLVGVLLSFAFASYHCAQHGQIARSQFPAEVRSKMLINTLLLTFAAVAVLVLLVAILVAVN
jgi:hypothetical protein